MEKKEHTEKKSRDFIRQIIDEDLKNNKHNGVVHTRFPPEPNGYLHIGHAKSISLNFGIAEEFENGMCNLRFDDTNPEKEDTEYVEAIKKDIKWLGFDWEDRLYFASDYFGKLYEFARYLIKEGLAYVCELNEEEIREYRGTVKEAGKPSPYRNRPREESLELLEKMKNGEIDEGKMTLRAKIDMAASNMKMRDPLMYRIRKTEHHRTGKTWSIYPMYDFAHCLSDAIENITHSICTMEFENNRELYDWFVEKAPVTSQPHQYEFARLNLTYTVMSKRKLLSLVQKNIVDGWDDPRMPTISGMRRRGYTPASIRRFCEEIGVAKAQSTADIALLEYCLRQELNKTAERVMAVLDPLKIVITNYPEDKTEEFDAVNNPEDESAGTRKVPFSREIWIERSDFMENAPRKFFRLAVGKEVRLKHAYYITCNEVVKNESGEITELHCSYDPETRGGWSKDGRKVKGTLHWVSAKHCFDAEVRLYDHLFRKEDPEDVTEGEDFTSNLNNESLIIRKNCKMEPHLMTPDPEMRYQFLRTGYFVLDSKLSKPKSLVFNRAVSLKDAWARMNKNK